MPVAVLPVCRTVRWISPGYEACGCRRGVPCLGGNCSGSLPRVRRMLRLGGRRDAGLIAVLYGAGLRRSEVTALDLSDYKAEITELRVWSGKGQKDRLCYVTNGAKSALDIWLTARGNEPGPLFWPADGRGWPLVNRRMTDQAVLLLLRRRAAQAKIAAFTPHDLRRSFISDLLDAGADMVTVQKLAGHANVRGRLGVCVRNCSR